MQPQPLLLTDPASPSEKIISLTYSEEKDPFLEEHLCSLKQVVDKIFGKELFCDEKISEKLPLIRWTDCQQVPGAFYIYLLANATKRGELHLFLHEMVSHWLVSGDQLQILGSRNFTFQIHEKPSHSYYFVELLVEVDNPNHLELIQSNLPGLEEEIRLSSVSKGYAKHILEMKRLSLGGDTSQIYQTFISAMRRHPKRFEHDIFREIQRFLVHYKKQFRESHDIKHLCRIISAHYLFHKALLQDSKEHPNKRALYFKLLKTAITYPFGQKKVLGIAIAVNSLQTYECFEERHILKAVQRVLPDVKVIVDSFHAFRNEDSKILTLYIELEKINEKEFTLTELIVLRKKLLSEFKNSIEYLSPSLFVIPRNEEELYRNIFTLSQELRFVADLPQVILSFHEQRNDILKFNITLLRLLRPGSISLSELSQKLPPHDVFIQERVKHVDLLRKKYVKEANVFSLEIESRHFLRKNHSIDLLKARSYVSRAIETLVGPFRDYNGGFLAKQNEQLESIKAEIGEEGRLREFHVDTLFYSLTPAIMQTLIPPKAGKLLFSVFLKSLEMPLSAVQGYVLNTDFDEEIVAVVAKVKLKDFKEKALNCTKDLETEPLKLAFGTVEVESHCHLCFLYLKTPKENPSLFIENVTQSLNIWAKAQMNRQIVRLYLPRATTALDPRVGGDRTSGIVLKMLYEGLMRIGVDGKPECAIAEDAHICPEWKTFTFKLKKTFWSNGSPVTAFDFEYAWKKTLEPTFRSLYSFLLFVIKNAERAKRNECPLSDVGVKALDSDTLQVELQYPSKHFLSLTAHWIYSPLCCDMDQLHPGWAYQNADSHISNGPFKLQDWKLNDDLKVVKNPHYWNSSKVKLDKIEVDIVEDDKLALEMFKRGEFDWFGDPITKIPLKELKELKVKGALHSNLSGLFWLQLNVHHPLFTSTKVRKALSYAIDRKYLIESLLQRDDEPALSLYRPGLPRFADNNKELAQTLFKEGLKELKLNLENVGPVVFSHSEIEEHEVITREIGRVWQETFGLQIQYERQIWNEYFQSLIRNEHMVGGMSWYSRSDDPLYFLDLLIYRDAATSISKWKNPTFTKVLENAKREVDPLNRNMLIFEAEKIALEEMPVIPILFDKWRYAINPRLKGVNLSMIGQLDFREAYLDYDS